MELLALVLSLAGAPEAEPEATTETEAPTEEADIPDLGELDPLPGAAPPSEGLPDLGELGATAPPKPPSPSTPDPGLASSEPEGESFGDIFTGSVRLTGAFLHFDDEPTLFPNGDDALLASVFRVIAERDLGRHFGIEMNYFMDLSRVPGGGSVAGAFSTAGSTDSVYRSPWLTYGFWNDGSVRGRLGTDRFVVDAQAGPVNIAVGRFPITYSVTGLLTPNDFFAPFSAAAVNRIYKPGVDAVRVGSTLGMKSSIEVVGVLGNDDGGTPTWGRSGLVARAARVQWGFEWSVLGGKVAERWVAGASSQGDVGPVSLRGEAHVGVPDRDGDGRGAEDDDAPIHVRLAAGPSVNVGWHGLTLAAEYSFISDGAKQPELYLARALERFPDDQPQLARHYVSASGGAEIVPILNASVFALVNANDGSGLTGLSLIYSVADEADIIGGLFVPWGGDPFATGDPTAPVGLRSEQGASPLTVYLEARAFF